MSDKKKRCMKKALAAAIMMLMLIGCGQKGQNKETAAAFVGETQTETHTGSIQKEEATEEITTAPSVKEDETDALDENKKETAAVYGNGGHFVGYDGKILFLSPGDDSMQTAALWGIFDRLTDGQRCRVAAYDPETQYTEYLFEGAYFGGIIISGSRLVLSGTGKDTKPFVHSVNFDGSDPKELPGTALYGTEPSGGYFVTGGYEESDSRIHFYICGSDGSWKDLKSDDGFYDYAGIGGGYAFFITGSYENSGHLTGYRLETGEPAAYGKLPDFYELTGNSYPGTPEQLYTEDGKIYLHLAAYEGSGHFYAASSFMSAECDRPDSLEEIFPEYDLRTAERFDTAPTVAVIEGKLAFVDGVPGTAAVNSDGNVGTYDENGIFVSVAAGYGDIVDEANETMLHTEFCEEVNGDIYLVRNREERAPEDDIGWREAYRRLQTYICRIDKKSGASEIVDYIENPLLQEDGDGVFIDYSDVDAGVEEARAIVKGMPEIRKQMAKGMKLIYGGAEEINGTYLDVFELGTGDKESFVRESVYAADSLLGTVYRYDAQGDRWEQVPAAGRN